MKQKKITNDIKCLLQEKSYSEINYQSRDSLPDAGLAKDVQQTAPLSKKATLQFTTVIPVLAKGDEREKRLSIKLSKEIISLKNYIFQITF